MIYRFHNISLDTQLYQIKHGDHLIPVEPQVFDLLVYLIQNHQRVVTRNELLDKLWSGKVVSDAALNGRLKTARKALGDSGRAQNIIKTVHRRGYQFVAPVSLSDRTEDRAQELPMVSDDGSVSSSMDTSPKKPSILVLPFTNRSHDPEDEYFVYGITDEVRLCLYRFRQILVIARESSMELANTDPVSAAKQLAVDYVLDGNVQRAGDRVRIFTRLLKGGNREQLWAEQYDRQLKDVFQVQDDIAQKITSTLVGQIESDSRVQAMHKVSTNLTAYDYYLRGNYYFDDWNGTREHMVKAEKMYSTAIELAPELAAAYAGIALVQLKRLDSGWTDSAEVTGNTAFKFASKAVDLDERDGNARLALAYSYFIARSDFDRATAQIRIALELNPNDYQSYCIGGWICLCSGSLEEGIRCSREALRRNPLLPDMCLMSYGFTEYLGARYEHSIEIFNRMSKSEPEVDACIAACYAQLGNGVKASAAVKAFLAHIDKNPGNDADAWRKYWIEKLGRFKNEESLDHLVEGVFKAGLID